MIAIPDRLISRTVFESLTVPFDKLCAVVDTREKRIPVGTQWRLAHSLPETLLDTPQTELALGVAFKILSRGWITVLPEALEAALDRSPNPGSGSPRPRAHTDLDSDEERQFWTNVLPRYLGPRGHYWCTAQVVLADLVNDPKLHATEQRVDFVIAHPQLVKPLVVEIDGSQHAQRSVQGAARGWEGECGDWAGRGGGCCGVGCCLALRIADLPIDRWKMD